VNLVYYVIIHARHVSTVMQIFNVQVAIQSVMKIVLTKEDQQIFVNAINFSMMMLVTNYVPPAIILAINVMELELIIVLNVEIIQFYTELLLQHFTANVMMGTLMMVQIYNVLLVTTLVKPVVNRALYQEIVKIKFYN